MKLTDRARYVIVLLICSGATACALQTRGDLPSVHEARVFLSEIVTLAQRGDFTSLCALGDGNCERSLDLARRDTVPPTAPRVIDVRLLQTTRSDDQVSIGGVILVMCGRDGTGAPYQSEMLVFRDGSSLRAINPIYWGNMRIAGGDRTTASPVPIRAC